MVRCKEFYDKWAEDENWCEKCKGAVTQINNYIELAKELNEKYDVEKEFTFVNLPEGAVRALINEKNPQVKELVISEIGNRLKSEQKRKERGLKPQKIKVKPTIDTIKRNVAAEAKTKKDWDSKPEPEIKTKVPTPKIKSNAKFNFTNENIEWAQWTWNPVRGCEHGCDYCYAKDIAMRFDGNFDPEFFEDRLAAPYNTKLTDEQIEEIGSAHHLNKTHPLEMVFVCSMADLFGDWVPPEWIEAVMKVVIDTPQWTYLFLTKNPKRLVGIDFPENCWVGATIDKQRRVKPTEEAMREVKAPIKFVSCEPLLESIKFNDVKIFDWIIIGGCSPTKSHKEVQPEYGWVKSIEKQAWCANDIPVYFKPNMESRPKEYPK